MATDLKEIKERLAFCKDEIRIIEGEINAYCTESIKITNRPSWRPNSFIIEATIVDSIPTKIRSRIGTTINEIRSCLDALACQLAIRNSENTKGVYFPVSKSETIFNDDGMKKIKKLSAADQVAIAALKPYAEGNPLLFALHDSDRDRKHIKLGAVAAIPGPFGIGGTGFVHGVFRGPPQAPASLERAGQVIKLLMGTVEPTIRVGADVLIVFDEPPVLKGRDVIGTLNAFVNIANSIVSKFD
jgi:hypothetical protein